MVAKRAEQNIVVVVLLAASILMVSCRSSQPAPMQLGEPIPPNTCRVVLTILSIDPRLQSSIPDDPCSKAPCHATVRVDSILGYGSAFGNPFSIGEVIAVQFAFTVSPTKELLPTLSRHYPGVNSGARLSTDIQSRGDILEAEGKQARFLIYGYRLQ